MNTEDLEADLRKRLASVQEAKEHATKRLASTDAIAMDVVRDLLSLARGGEPDDRSRVVAEVTARLSMLREAIRFEIGYSESAWKLLEDTLIQQASTIAKLRVIDEPRESAEVLDENSDTHGFLDSPVRRQIRALAPVTQASVSIEKPSRIENHLDWSLHLEIVVVTENEKAEWTIAPLRGLSDLKAPNQLPSGPSKLYVEIPKLSVFEVSGGSILGSHEMAPRSIMVEPK